MESTRKTVTLSRWTLAALVSVPVLVLSAVGIAAIPSADGVFTACVAKRGGEVRVIDPAKTKCKDNEVQVKWNEKGRRGPAGATRAFQTGPAGNTVMPADNTYHPLATLTVPGSAKGSYLVQFSTELYNNFNETIYGNCRVTAPSGTTAGYSWSIGAATNSTDFSDSLYVSGSAPVTIGAEGGTIAFECVGSKATGVIAPNMSAILTNVLTVQ